MRSSDSETGIERLSGRTDDGGEDRAVERSSSRRSPGRLTVIAAMFLLAPALFAASGTSPLGARTVALVAGNFSGEPDPVSAQTAPAGGFINYRHVDTWSDEPWSLQPGRFARAADLSSDASGATYVLDRIHRAVHRRAADGTWSAVVIDRGETGSERHPERIDAAPSGGYSVLWRGELDGERRARVVRYSADGEMISGFETGLDHNDLAFGPTGDIFLTRRVPRVEPPEEGPRPPGGVDVMQPDGALAASIEGGDVLYFPSGVDVDSDGTVYVIDWRPSPEPIPPPFPRPTARPSSARSSDSALVDPAQEPVPPAEGPPEGVVIFEPDLRLRERVDFYAADDVAVGPAGAFVSRQLEIFALRDPEAVWVGPTGSIYIPYYGAPVHISVPLRGPVLQASVDHCWFQGMLDFKELDFRVLGERLNTPVFDGQLDRPALAGPWRPARIDAGDDPGVGVRVLQDRFQTESASDAGAGGGLGDGKELAVLAGPWGAEPQSVQQWSIGGRLHGQVGVCGDDQAWFERRSEARKVLDVAVDGGVGSTLVLTIEPELARAQSEDPAHPLPIWTLWPGALDEPGTESDADLRAIDADKGVVAILDDGAGRVILAPSMPDSDIVAESRAFALGGSAAASVDLALRVDVAAGASGAGASRSGRIALADAGERSVRLFDMDGGTMGGWRVHDTPVAIAYGPTGDLFVLGAGKWILRYREDGTLVARWPMPEADVGAEAEAVEGGGGDSPATDEVSDATPPETLALDLTVDATGRVLVPFVRRREHSLSAVGEAWWRIEEAGVWVFEEAEAVPGTPPDASACLVATDKRAAPAAIRRGGTVDVVLEVRGLCPAVRGKTRIMLVLDVSRSMSWDGALPRARTLATALVEAVAAGDDQLGLITFADAPALVAPPDSDRGPVLRALNAARAGGDTLLGPALELAAEALGVELDAPVTPPAGVRDAVVVLTDGRPSDYPIVEADALRAAGVDLRFVVVPGRDYQAIFTTVLANLAGGDRDKVLVAPEPSAVRGLFERLSDARRPDQLFESLEVVDRVPTEMRYVDGSAEPVAAWDAAERTLTWSLGPIDKDKPVGLHYKLEPLLDGLWPTNVFAYAAGRDGAGFDQRLDFPIPYVSVWSPESLVERAYLPFTSALRCLRPVPRDVVLVIDASRSMDDPTREGGPTKIRAAVDAAVAFIERSSPERDRTAVVAFNSDALVVADLSADPKTAVDGLERITTAPGTAIDTGLEAAATVLRDARREAVRAVLLLSDGRHAGDPEEVRRAAASLESDGNLIFAVALGSDADEELLREISVGGAFAATGEAEGVARLFAAMDEALRCLPPAPVMDRP